MWNDVNYLVGYAEMNGISDKFKFAEDVLKNVKQLEDIIERFTDRQLSLSQFFLPLQDSEYKRELALQKGKLRQNRLRLYAIKIEENCFVITGGAIKMSGSMHEHEDTLRELHKLKKARAYLKENGVFDDDSFFEFIMEQS